MYNILITEIQKLKRSKMLWLVFLVSILPALVKFVQSTLREDIESIHWEEFLYEHQDLMVLGMISSVILMICFIFNMEYQHCTIAYVFTSPVPRVKLFIGKIITGFLVITFLFLSSFISTLVFGFLTVRAGIPSGVLYLYLKVNFWSILMYGSLTAVIALISIIAKKFVVSATVVLGYIMLVFPIHLKGNAYICPFMIPAVMAAKISGSKDYIFSNYYKDVAVNYCNIAAVLCILFAVSLVAGVLRYKKADVV